MGDNEVSPSVRILMLEDNLLDAELAAARLRKADLHPEIVLTRDRREYEAAVEAGGFDLILADYALPDFDGIAALALAREKLPGCPFIFISGRVGEEVAIDTLQRGATDYVLKHRLERLVPAVLRALNESREHSIRVETEQKFRQSELRFRQVIDAVPEMIWVATPDGTLTYANQAWNDRVPPGTTHWCRPELFHPDDYRACLLAWQEAVEHRECVTLETRFRRHGDTAWRWHLLRVTPLALDGSELSPKMESDQLQWLCTAFDLQDQKLNEEALRTAEKLSVTGRMAAAIAHEINNPLESMTNLLFLVRLESENNPRALEFLSIAEAELERISSITRQTLQFYRDPSMPTEIDVREILDEVLRLFRTRILGKRIQASLQSEPSLNFQAIKGEIRQVLINLVNNAIDAVEPRGLIEIEASTIEHAGGPGVQILVHDNGSGITPEQAGRLFTPFFSTKGSLGTGLGLWVSKGILEKHGGRLHLQTHGTDDARRTTATVVLPREAAPNLGNQPAVNA